MLTPDYQGQICPLLRLQHLSLRLYKIPPLQGTLLVIQSTVIARRGCMEVGAPRGA